MLAKKHLPEGLYSDSFGVSQPIQHSLEETLPSHPLLSFHSKTPATKDTAMRALALVVFILVIFSLQTAQAASPESFETYEYKASGALDIINASQAYALGYTGLGQTVGVIDTPVRVDHPELAGKADMMPVTEDGAPITPDWREIKHGSHVAGIIAAKRDGIGMHGVAFGRYLGWSIAGQPGWPGH